MNFDVVKYTPRSAGRSNGKIQCPKKQLNITAKPPSITPAPPSTTAKPPSTMRAAITKRHRITPTRHKGTAHMPESMASTQAARTARNTATTRPRPSLRTALPWGREPPQGCHGDTIGKRFDDFLALDFLGAARPRLASIRLRRLPTFLNGLLHGRRRPAAFHRLVLHLVLLTASDASSILFSAARCLLLPCRHDDSPPICWNSQTADVLGKFHTDSGQNSVAGVG